MTPRQGGHAPDPQTDLVYRAEDRALGDQGPILGRWPDVVAFVDRVVGAPEWAEAEPSLPLDVGIERRSRSARYAAAHAGLATIWIPDGQWNVVTVLHELAHLVAPAPESHGPRFAAAELWLVRWVLGFEAYGALRTAFDLDGVRYDDVEPGHPSAAASS